MRINHYFLSLIKKENDPIWKQAVPDLAEINDDFYLADPLCEEIKSPVKNLVHRYPNRVLFLVSNQCALYCRHCMRKRRNSYNSLITEDTIEQGIEYISKTDSIEEVILSGGDPLLLEDELLKKILKKIRKISHVDILRIHTRVPCTLPHRITKNLLKIIKQFQPIYINTHFNHPDEITTEAKKACISIADSGIPLGNQTVLLKDINNNHLTIKALLQNLLKIRVKPYYIHHPDLVKGTAHFRLSIEEGLKIIKKLQGNISGLAIPHYMIDLPGGGGKIPLIPEHVKFTNNTRLTVENFKGEFFEYPLK